MRLCPACSYANREGFLFCENCGQHLQEAQSVMLPTRQIEQTTSDLYARATWGTARFNTDASIVLHVRDVADPVVLQPTKRTILGRMDGNSISKPDFDLTPYGAVEKGVSRIHAAIFRNDDTLILVDMGSANGTHLNGQRLVPEQPRVLRDGDEIRLGKMVIHVYFKSGSLL